MAQSNRYNVTRYEVLLVDGIIVGPLMFVDILTVEVEIHELMAANDNDPGDFALELDAVEMVDSAEGNAAYVYNGQVFNTLAAEDGSPERPFTLPVEDGSPEAPFTLELVEDGSPERPFTLKPDAEITRKNRGTPEDCEVILVYDGADGVTTAVNPKLLS